jgi:Zn-dependent protease with chaperone function
VNAFGHVLFNLLANSVLSFVGALALVGLTLRLARVGQGRCRLWLLMLPFAKVLLDMAAGVPESSFLWAKAAGHAQELGQFRFGVGVQQFGPIIDLQLGAFSGGVIYPQSFGDVLDTAISKRLGAWVPALLAAVVAAVGCWRFWTRGRRQSGFLREALRDARVVEQRSVRGRAVQILLSQRYEGVPFAIGVFSPRVVFSARTYAAFDAAEREAALQHELAHIAHRDLTLLAALSAFVDLFWFLPGLRGSVARIQSVLEYRADDAAVAAGAAREVLASALVRAGEALAAPAPGAAILSSRTLLALRVQRLLAVARSPHRPRLSKAADVVRVGLAAVITLLIAQSIFLGNHAAALVRFAHL